MTTEDRKTAGLPESEAEWLALIEHDPVLRDRLHSMTAGNTFTAIVRDVMCARLNEVVGVVDRKVVNALEANGVSESVVRAIVLVELQNLSDVVIAKIDDRLIDTIVARVAAALKTEAAKGGKKR